MQTDKEIWKPVKDYEGLYKVSSHGRVRSLDRIDGKGRRRKGVFLCETLNKGHWYVGLSKDTKNKKLAVHRLVALAFCDGYAEGLEVWHKDGDQDNNHYTNLKWDNPKRRAKLTEEQVLEIRRLYATGNYSQKKLGKMFGVSQVLIGKIARGERWKNI